MTGPKPATPDYAADLFSDEVVSDPHPHYAALRDLGSAVWLPATGVFAVARYDDVRAVLGDAETFISGEGVGFNRIVNDLTKGNTLNSDNPEHDHLRSIVASELTPRAVRGRADGVAEAAQRVVAAAVARGEIDAVADIAQAMPMSVVPDFIGLPTRGRERLFDWAAAALDTLGPDHPRLESAFETAGLQVQYAIDVAQGGELLPDSLAANLLTAVERGDIGPEKCPVLMLDYLGPSLETTASALGHLLVLLARHPEQWELLRAAPGLVTAALNETLRLESPLRGFSRIASRETEIGGMPVPAGSRVWPIVASANRDPLKWGADADEFRIERNPVDHVAFGYGVHGCAGQGLAKLEIHAIIHALLAQVRAVELVGEPVWLVNSIANTFASVPLRLVAA
ncbi:cytochrome P450 [Microbacterium sp. 18062]|uniref:cytochrome P450 n=1 Tax=Microbacterium sp. 18062 TaxID=2681410 RepID=UPI001358DDA7|nr:cytochrome P450 [Microbacterium sp. 18062]